MADEVTRHRTSSPKPCPPPALAPPPTHTPQKFNHRMEIGLTSSTDQQTMDRSHEVSLDINEIATSLRDQLKTNKAFSRECCIYRVPARLRRLNEKAYTPSVVSIGPLHHDKKNLKAMEDHKIMYLQEFLERSKVSVEDLINIVRDNETELRDCYSESIVLSRKDFATMILLDAVFVIMVLLKCNCVGESHGSRIGDQIFRRPFKFVDVVWDMCLLENQLPFFILEKLFELSSVAVNPKKCTVIELTSQLLHKIMEEWVKEDSWKTVNSSEVLHFVDFIRKCQQPTERSSEERRNTRRTDAILSATKLRQYGVKFKQHPRRKSLFDVSFNERTLEIPQLTIDDRTETLLRNLQAFEQCHYMYAGRFVSDYINFISCLVRAPNDVAMLSRNGTLKNMLKRDGAVSNLLYNLGKENVVSENSFLCGVYERLECHCHKLSHVKRALYPYILKQFYFNSSGTILISVAAATLLLILTVIQTVCSILQL